MENTAQERFNKSYITSSEICKKLGVSRAAVVQARQNGKLPDPIFINDTQICIWERTTVQSYLVAWEDAINTRRALTNG